MKIQVPEQTPISFLEKFNIDVYKPSTATVLNSVFVCFFVFALTYQQNINSLSITFYFMDIMCQYFVHGFVLFKIVNVHVMVWTFLMPPPKFIC